MVDKYSIARKLYITSIVLLTGILIRDVCVTLLNYGSMQLINANLVEYIVNNSNKDTAQMIIEGALADNKDILDSIPRSMSAIKRISITVVVFGLLNIHGDFIMKRVKKWISFSHFQ